MEAQKSKKKGKKKTKKKKTKYSSEKQGEESNKKDAPPLKSEDYDGWKSWYKQKILKALDEGKEETQIAFELEIQPQSIKNFLK